MENGDENLLGIWSKDEGCAARLGRRSGDDGGDRLGDSARRSPDRVRGHGGDPGLLCREKGVSRGVRMLQRGQDAPSMKLWRTIDAVNVWVVKWVVREVDVSTDEAASSRLSPG